MVVPYVHKTNLEELNPEIRAEIIELSTKSIVILREEYQPQGFNVGANIGEVAGAGILNHIHIHIVPRWKGDTNFMSSVSNTRVLPETLEDTYHRILAAWK